MELKDLSIPNTQVDAMAQGCSVKAGSTVYIYILTHPHLLFTFSFLSDFDNIYLLHLHA